MERKVSMKEKSIKFKILTVPLIIIFIVASLISVIAIKIAQATVMNQLKGDGTNLANGVAKQVGNNAISLGTLNESIESRIKTLGKFIVGNVDKVNNDYLSELASQFEVDEINVTDPNGIIIYSNLQSSINAVFDSNHISYPVLKGEKTEFMENIRKSRENNNYYKYGYIRKNDGGIVQIGILANKVQKLSASLEVQKLVEDMVKDNSSIVYALFIDKNLKATAHSEKDRIGIALDDIGSKTAAVDGKLYSSTFLHKNKIEVYDILVPVYSNGVHIGAIDIGFSLDNETKTIHHIISYILIIAVLAIAISSFILIKIEKSIVSPLENLVQVSKKISNGEFDSEVVVYNNDEIGILASSFKQMSDSLKGTIGTIKRETARVSSMAYDLNSNAEQMNSSVDQVAHAVENVTTGATQQASDLMEVVNHMSSLEDELKNIENKLSRVRESSDMTANKAMVGKDQIDLLLKSIEDIKNSFKTVAEKVNSLNSSVSQVGNITDVINDISEQTNLLALNAAIEAARAGEAGKGFSVVAEEVRNLAEQSKESTEQIQKLIYSISSETANVMTTADEVRELVNKQVNTVQTTISSFNDMIEAITGIPPLVDDTYGSLENTIKSKDIVLTKVEGVTSVSQETSAASEEISASSQEMFASTEEVAKFALELSEVAKQLDKETDNFKL
ncbi:methyl-accepting chemotaxis protein [Clostridium magnum]|uniref:Methyl-accepting chemotaxis protein McpB n=1 Tax=Clostridium magnum DSM 2767 TaxID=1121326 RepID=A0A161XCN5_9CLOT|nr:methyl-accepting chemotaxis protein [Clostridium magnum]KZL92086.1 methyl-accepting chemotaxis protein McpB [Clostridium magnum DSM 2767]SHH23025.1 Methyl-accepting chemotaxis protein [Clostridium magnum DSM 2767]